MKARTMKEDTAQMVMPRINGKDLADPAYRRTIDDLVKEGMGGFILFGGDIDQTPRRLRELQSSAEVPLLILKAGRAFRANEPWPRR
jgi:hypothetical protein